MMKTARYLFCLLIISLLFWGCEKRKEGTDTQQKFRKERLHSYAERQPATPLNNQPTAEDLAEVTVGNPLKHLKYKIAGETVTISGCDEWAKGRLLIPKTIEGLLVAEIGTSAFNRSKALTSIVIPDGVSSIAVDAFNFCSNLAAIEVSGQNMNYSSIDGVLFNKKRTRLLKYPTAKTDTEYTIPESVTSIGEEALGYSKNLTAIAIPDGVISIALDSFFLSSNLAAIEVGGKNVNYTSIDGALFNKEKTDLIDYPQAKPITNYTIPEGVINIGAQALAGCKNLTSITIPETVRSIGVGAFNHSSNLKSITIPEGPTMIPSIAFSFCTSLTNIDIPQTVTSIGDQAFMACVNLKSIKIPDGVTSIGQGAFINCNELTIITIPVGVRTIEKETFAACPKLKSITIPESVTNLGEGSFASCASLTGITLPKSVSDIGGYAFLRCTSLTELIFFGDAPKVADDSLEGSSSTIYRKPEAKGWGETFGGRPVKLISDKP